MLKPKVGIEVEFLTLDAKGNVIITPKCLGRDTFPLLGEIRALPGENAAETYINFVQAQEILKSNLATSRSFVFSEMFRVPLKLYKEANKEMAAANVDKDTVVADVKNIYGTDISEFSDQVIEKGKIQGVNISCGLHVHFSCQEIDECEVKEDVYESVVLPIALPNGVYAKDNVVHELLKPNIYLYRKIDSKVTKKLKASVSRLNKPTIDYIVREMDKKFFDALAPEKANRTKYRQPGFYELKPYGFEYRSLPASPKSIAALQEIIAFSFKLLKEV